jgi:MerR family Zn(II)-responsive transcriptional regulator of zntA
MPSLKLRIGRVAQSASLSPDAIRHYERIGLLTVAERTAGGYRMYTPDDVRRVRVIQAALAAGFTLDELAAIFAERRAGRSPCRRVRALAGEKLQHVEAELEKLRRLRRALARTLVDWDERLGVTPPGRPAGLLEALADSMSAGPRSDWPARPFLRPMPTRRRKGAK